MEVATWVTLECHATMELNIKIILDADFKLTLDWQFSTETERASWQKRRRCSLSLAHLPTIYYTTAGVHEILGAKVQCLICFESSTTEGRGGEKGRSANCRTEHTEPLTQGFCAPLYTILRYYYNTTALSCGRNCRAQCRRPVCCRERQVWRWTRKRRDESEGNLKENACREQAVPFIYTSQSLHVIAR